MAHRPAGHQATSQRAKCDKSTPAPGVHLIARVTLNPLIESLSGKVGGTNLRRTRSGTLVVKPSVTLSRPSDGQLAQRDLFRRTSHAEPQSVTLLGSHWEHYAALAGLPTRQYYISKQLAMERDFGLSPIVTEIDGPREVSIITAIPIPPPGTVLVGFTPTVAPEVYIAVVWLKQYIGPGLLHATKLLLDPAWFAASTSGIVIATGLTRGRTYTAVVSFLDTTTWVAGPSDIVRVTASP